MVTFRPLTAAARATLLPQFTKIEAVRRAAAGCRACALWKNATQTVFGEGPPDAPLMLVGEQPGDQEDVHGRPVVGPAGQMLRRAMAEAEIDPNAAYITNAVKHFKFEPRGKKRIHSKPRTTEVRACYPWLGKERELIAPDVTVLMGATAVVSVLGKAVSIKSLRGKPVPLPDGKVAFVTVHPSSLLRIPDRDARHQAFRDFVKDFTLVREHMKTRKRVRKIA
jgi:DNA polymerase